MVDEHSGNGSWDELLRFMDIGEPDRHAQSARSDRRVRARVLSRLFRSTAADRRLAVLRSQTSRSEDVFDRPKTIALKWGRDGVVTEWNATFAGVALDLGIGVEVCWPYRPQENGSVENLVGWVKGSFFKQRRFLDRADLEPQLREWLTEANRTRPSRATGVPPAARIAEDRARLRPLKVAPADLALRIPTSVTPTGVVMHEGHPYSMPPDATACRRRSICIATACASSQVGSAPSMSEIRARRQLDSAGAPRAARRRGVGQTGSPLSPAAASH
jgi:hypothetical protein